jgi:pilus assembly protein CpaC
MRSLQDMSRILLSALLLAASFTLVPPRAVAADDPPVVVASAGSNRLMRLAVNKSVVIRLPAAAKDVLVGNPGVVDAVIRTHSMAYLFARAPGQTNIFFFDEKGQQILDLDLEVTRDPSALQRMIERTLPDARITVDTMGDSVILNGLTSSSEDANKAIELAIQLTGDEKKVVSNIAVTGKEQVTLKVRVAEVQRSALRRIGVNSGAAIKSAGGFIANIYPRGFGSVDGNILTTGYAKGNDAIAATLEALEREGLMRTLAEPNLTAISGQSAKFLAGGEFPIPVKQNKDGDLTVQFKPYGVGLGFTPQVLSEGRISMKISAEVSELSEEGAVTVNNISVRGIKTRRAETTMEMPSGSSMVMAGLISDTQRNTVNGVAGLKELPVLGALFRSREYQSAQTELVVIVTPYVVEAVSPSELASPGETLGIANETDSLFFGQLNKIYGSGTRPQSRWRGQVGYIVE